MLSLRQKQWILFLGVEKLPDKSEDIAGELDGPVQLEDLSVLQP